MIWRSEPMPRFPLCCALVQSQDTAVARHHRANFWPAPARPKKRRWLPLPEAETTRSPSKPSVVADHTAVTVENPCCSRLAPRRRKSVVAGQQRMLPLMSAQAPVCIVSVFAPVTPVTCCGVLLNAPVPVVAEQAAGVFPSRRRCRWCRWRMGVTGDDRCHPGKPGHHSRYVHHRPVVVAKPTIRVGPQQPRSVVREHRAQVCDSERRWPC